MFKEFYAAAMPVIACEGKTDSVYLRHAIKNLTAAFPILATSAPGKSTILNVRIPSYPLTATGHILRLSGGTGSLKLFIPEYLKELKRFKAPGMQNPVILLIDNDDGAKHVYELVKNACGKKPTGQEQFVRIAGNLYLVATPFAAGRNSSMIEDSFGTLPSTLKLDGKTFNADDKTFDAAIHYGKHVFSQHVKDHANKIDFTGFKAILTRLVAVIEAYKLIRPKNPS
jgi:hypothetical protein